MKINRIKWKSQRGAAMLLALFTVIILAAVGAAFFAITLTESKTTTSRIESDLALEMATAGLEYTALVASVQTNNINGGGSFWIYKDNKSQPDFLNDKIFKSVVGSGDSQLVFNIKDPSNPREQNQLLLANKSSDNKIVGCMVFIHPLGAPGDQVKYPDIVVTSTGYIVGGTDADFKMDNDTTCYATRTVQAVLKEVSFYNYTYIYKNFTDLDLPFNVPPAYREAMQNMVGLTPGTDIYGGVRADGVKDPNGNKDDPNTNRVGRLLLWDKDGKPINSTTVPDPNHPDPNNIAQIYGPVRLVSDDKYDGSGTFVVDPAGSEIGPDGKRGYHLNNNMTAAFQGSSKQFEADQRGVPGANSSFMPSILSSVGGFAPSPPMGTTSINTVNVGGEKNVAINNTTIATDGDAITDGHPLSQGEDLNGDEKPDYSKNICKLSFSVNTDGKTVVTIDIRNRYKGLTSEETSSDPNGTIAAIFSTPACQVSSQTIVLDQDAVLCVNGGNVMIDGEVGSGVTVVAKDSRTDPTDVTHTLDQMALPETTDPQKFFRHMEKDDPQGSPASEGNIFVTGDLTQKEGKTAALGLVSENFTYLHKLKTASGDYKQLDVRAQMNSVRQSVQFDFFNYLRETGYFDAGGAGNKDFKGTFNFEGQMVGNHSDVEGDTDGRGYATHLNIKYDDNLRYYSAPMFFNEDYSQVTEGTLQFAISGFFDMGSLGSVKGAP